MPHKQMTPAQHQQAEQALAKARDSQTAFWADLHALEEVLGVALATEDDLAETTLDHLLTIRSTRPEAYQ